MVVQRAVTPPLSSTVSSILTPSITSLLGRSSTVERPPLKRWAEGSSPSAPALGSGATGSAAASEADG
jgi:hypothetical protein